jgi:REP element-mobilizing transposase RayT
MPRGARLDAPDALHHVIVRGLEKRPIVHSDTDREDLLRRLEKVSTETGMCVLAWALLPNHFHLLVRTGPKPLATAMRQLLTGYAVAFNRRHRRVGHLFHNRYKSILVEDDPYLLELVRYIHLNPIRSGEVQDLKALGRYPWTGHSVLLGHSHRRWQAVEEVLGNYHRIVREARRRYRAFLAEGLKHGRRPELQGGGLRRSVGGWEAIAALRRGRERWASDERILGSSDFVDRMRRTAHAEPAPWGRTPALKALPKIIARCAAAWGITPAEVHGAGRRRPVVYARYAASSVAVKDLGLPIALVARRFGVTPPVVREALTRGKELLLTKGLTARAVLTGLRK